MKAKHPIPGLPPMAALALVLGGFTGHLLLFAVVVFFIAGGLIGLALQALNLHNAWKRRVR
jgi:hypothetical protein